MNYVDFHINDWASATVGLSFAERGMYLTMIQVYYRDEMPLAARDIERTVGVRTPEERDCLDYLLRTFFDLQDGFWHNSRCDEEIAAYHGRSTKARDAANRRWNRKSLSGATSHMPETCLDDAQPSHESCPDDARTMQTHPPGIAQVMPEPCKDDTKPVLNRCLPSNHLTSTTTTSTGVGAGPPWWDEEQDPVIRQVASCLGGLPKRNAAGDDLSSTEEFVRRFVAKARQAATMLGDEADAGILAMLEEFGDANRGKKLEFNSKPWAVVLSRWLENESKRWNQPRESTRAPRNSRQKPKPQWQQDLEDVNRGLGVAG
ncbi:MAG: YdaU family protein [Chthonomonas sp.]|nr:YdaU family protein [Chthonomonas sp.]